MFYFWIRKQVRKVMKPVPVKIAQERTYLFTFLYVFSAWCGFGVIFYHYLNGRRINREMDPSFDLKQLNTGMLYGRVLQADNMQIYELSGGTLRKTGVYHAADQEKLEEHAKKDFFGVEEVAN